MHSCFQSLEFNTTIYIYQSVYHDRYRMIHNPVSIRKLPKISKPTVTQNTITTTIGTGRVYRAIYETLVVFLLQISFVSVRLGDDTTMILHVKHENRD